MADIDQAATGEIVKFTARSPRGDNWMRGYCGSIEVSFDLPSDAQKARDFRETAKVAKMTIFDLSKLN
jgi:hypothetical protein